MNYKKEIKERVEKNTRQPIEEFLKEQWTPYIHNLKEAAEFCKVAIKEKKPIHIIGDYDCDGICSSKILIDIFKILGTEVKVRIPKRFSEGYGLSSSIIDEINEGVIITIDNGIASIEAIKKAKEKGLDVLIIDHHLAKKNKDGQVIFPSADIIVDPHVDEKSEFIDYCGAGLAYRLAMELGVANKEMLVVASLATVADVVPLIGANRTLVKYGLETIRKGIMPFGLREILKEIKLSFEYINELDYGFTLCPIFNASGRLFDNGAKKVLDVLNLSYQNPRGFLKVKGIISSNQKRKELCKEQLQFTIDMLEALAVPTNAGIILEHEKFHPGLVGITASSLVETYNVPVILLSEKENLLKGSGRSPKDIHLKKLLDSTNSLLEGYGGHSGAAGVTLKKENFNKFQKEFSDKIKQIERKQNTEEDYLELDLDKIEEIKEQLQIYAPYGEGNEQLLFHLKVNKSLFVYTPLGENQEHFQLKNESLKILGFGLNQEYLDLKENPIIEVIGTLENSYYNNKKETILNVKTIS